MPFGPASLLGVERFDSEAPVELIPGDADAEKEQIIRAIYRQVLGNAYVMDERQVVRVSSSSAKSACGSLSAASPRVICIAAVSLKAAPGILHRISFPPSFGRAPADFEEMRAHAERLDSKGYDADIDSG